MIRRPRRLRQHPAMRELVAETSLGASDLILPLFYADVNREIPSMPGVFQHDRDSMLRAVHDALDAQSTGKQKALDDVHHYLAEAEAQLDLLPDGKATQALRSLSGFTVSRVG